LATIDNQAPSKEVKGITANDERSLYQSNKPTSSTAHEIRKSAGVGVGAERPSIGSYEQNGQGKDTSAERNADKNETGVYQRDISAERNADKNETSSQSSWDKGEKHEVASDGAAADVVPGAKTGLLNKAIAKTGKSQGFLAGLWDKIKHFGGGIKAYLLGHPGLATGLKIAGGIGALAIALKAAHKAKLARQQQRRA